MFSISASPQSPENGSYWCWGRVAVCNPRCGQVLVTLLVLVATGVVGETLRSPASELDLPTSLGALDPWDPEAVPGQVRGLEVRSFPCLPTSCSVCQERGLWNCTAHHCAPPRAFCPRGLVYVPGACLLTCDSPDADHPCTPGSPGGCVCPPGTVLLVRLGGAPLASPLPWPLAGCNRWGGGTRQSSMEPFVPGLC